MYLKTDTSLALVTSYNGEARFVRKVRLANIAIFMMGS